jgi:hypothetical protein
MRACKNQGVVIFIGFKQLRRLLHIFSKHLQAIAVTKSKFCTEDPKILGTTMENLVTWVTWCLDLGQGLVVGFCVQVINLQVL